MICESDYQSELVKDMVHGAALLSIASDLCSCHGSDYGPEHLLEAISKCEREFTFASPLNDVDFAFIRGAVAAKA